MAGYLYIVTAPSGAGKTTLVRLLLENDPGIRLSISCTTRAPRAGEVDGREYYFVTKDATQQDLLAVFSAKPGQPIEARTAASLMSGTELHTLLKRVPGKRILVLDTCHSGAAGAPCPVANSASFGRPLSGVT